MLSINCARDEFGPMLFNVHGILESIPRARTSDYKHVNVKSLVLNNINDTYSVYPNTSIKGVNKKEANIIIRKHIWNTFFGLSNSYVYSETVHYPTTFAIYLKTKLGIDLPSLNNPIITESLVNNFTLLVRNVIFTRILYLFKPYLIETTNILIDKQPVTIHNDPVFEIKEQWKYWL